MRDSAAAPSESLGMTHRPLTDKYLHALRAVARGEVFRTYNSQAFKLIGPCSSRLLWSLRRSARWSFAGLSLHGAHCGRGGSITGQRPG